MPCVLRAALRREQAALDARASRGLLILRPALSRFCIKSTTHTTRGDGWRGPILDFADEPWPSAFCSKCIQVEAALAAELHYTSAFAAADTKIDIY